MDKKNRISFQLTRKIEKLAIDTNGNANIKLRFVHELGNGHFLTAYHGGVAKVILKNNGSYQELVIRYPGKYYCVSEIDSTQVLLGSSVGLFIFNHNLMNDFISGHRDESLEFSKLYFQELEGVKINTICKIDLNHYLVGAKGKGVYILNLSKNTITPAKSLNINQITQIIRLKKNLFAAIDNNSLYLLKVDLKNDAVKLISAQTIGGVNFIVLNNNNEIFITTKNGIYKTHINDLLLSSVVNIGYHTQSYHIKYNDSSKQIQWNCQASNFYLKNDIYKIRLVSSRDTQVFYTSNNFLELTGFKDGIYKAFIGLNTTQGIKSNTWKVLIKISPPWYWSMVLKLLYILGAVLLFVGIVHYFVKRNKALYERKTLETNLELAAVRNILNPHFVHNTLNSLQSLMFYKDFERVNDYIVRLSKWFRTSLRDNQEQIVPVAQELELILAYINLEKIKLPKSFKFLVLDRTRSASGVKVPFFLLQPILENVFKYSLVRKEDPKISIIVTEHIDCLEILIMDNGHGEKIINNRSSHSGLNIVRRKLELYDRLSKSKQKSNYKISFTKGKGAMSKIVIYNPVRIIYEK